MVLLFEQLVVVVVVVVAVVVVVVVDDDEHLQTNHYQHPNDHLLLTCECALLGHECLIDGIVAQVRVAGTVGRHIHTACYIVRRLCLRIQCHIHLLQVAGHCCVISVL